MVVAILLGGGIGLVLSRRQATAQVSSNPVQPTNRTVPSAVAHIPLVNQNGQATDLAALRGRIVILADFMTSCQEECPITTGALLEVERSLAADHLLNKVTIVEASIDGWRDTPSRFRAYQRTFGVPFTMLTGTVANLDRLWSWFGVIYQRVAEGKPPATNWQTGKPYTFDITHSDDTFVLDTAGNERAVSAGLANVGGKLPKSLAGMLNALGRQNLRNPGYGSWTPTNMLDAVSGVLGQPIPVAGS